MLRFVAERAGFEPALGYSPKHAFQACDLNRSSTSPWMKLYREVSPSPTLPQGGGRTSFPEREPAETEELPGEEHDEDEQDRAVHGP